MNHLKLNPTKPILLGYCVCQKAYKKTKPARSKFPGSTPWQLPSQKVAGVELSWLSWLSLFVCICLFSMWKLQLETQSLVCCTNSAVPGPLQISRFWWAAWCTCGRASRTRPTFTSWMPTSGLTSVTSSPGMPVLSWASQLSPLSVLGMLLFSCFWDQVFCGLALVYC